MKRFLSLLVVAALVLAMIPAVFAVEAQTLISVVDEEVSSSGYTFIYNADTAGTLTVTAGSCSPDWRYKVYGPNDYESIYMSKWSLSGHDHEITAGEWKVVFYAKDSSATNVEGTVSFDITFTPAEGSGEVEKIESIVSDTALALGDNTLTLDATAVTTIYAFEPTETGVYTFTAPEGAILGYWGAGEWFLTDPNSTTNTYEWTCTSVGQSAYIGVSGAEDSFNLNVAKNGDYEVVEIPLYTYENKAELNAFTLPEGATLGGYVDVYGETHTAVLGDDGYYHLDSADGDILLIDLNYSDIVLTDALRSDRPIMYAYTTDEDGNQVKYDIAAAVQAYEAVMDANGYYPLTEDLIFFYQVYAVGAGTFDYYVTGDYNKACIWMYCCRTMTLPAEPVEGESAENPIFVIDDGSDDDDATITYTTAEQAAEQTVYYAIQRVSGMTLTVTGVGNFVVTYNGQPYTAVDGVVTIPSVSAVDKWTPAIISIVGENAGAYSMVIASPEGDMMNPAELNTVDYNGNTATIVTGDQDGYYFTWTAPADGTLTLTMSEDNTAGWQLYAYNLTTYKQSETIFSNGEATSLTIEVAEGDEIQVVANTYDAENPYTAPAGEVVFDAWYTADKGTSYNPYEIYDTVQDTTAVIEYPTTVPAGETVYYTGRVNDTILTIDAENLTVTVDGVEVPVVDGVYTYEIPAAASFFAPAPVIVITNNGTEDAALALDFTYPAGHSMNPAELNTVDYNGNTATIVTGDQDGYYFTWTAPADGTLTLTMSEDNTAGWQIYAYNLTTYALSETIFSNGEATSLTIEVTEGDEIQVVANTYDAENPYTAPAGEVVFDAWYTADQGTSYNPYEIYDTVQDTTAVIEYPTTVPAGETVYYTGRVNDTILTIDAENLTVTVDGVEVPVVDGVYTYEIPAAASFFAPAPVIVITNNGTEDAALALDFTYPVGHSMNPAELQMGAQVSTVTEGGQGYYYTWTAPADGTLTLTMSKDNTAGWQIYANNLTTYAMSETIFSNGEATSLTIEVAEGDEIQVVANTYDAENPYTAPAGEVVFDAVFACGHTNMEHTEGKDPACNADGNHEYWYCAVCDTYFMNDENGNKVNTNLQNTVIPGGAEYHKFEHTEGKDPACNADGNHEYWYCAVCDTYFMNDKNGNKVNTNLQNTVIPGGAEYHKFEHTEGVEPTCMSDGAHEYWYCEVCDTYFMNDKNGNKVNTNSKDIVIPGGAEYHVMEHVEALEPTCHMPGYVEFWYCSVCECFFVADDNGNLINSNVMDVIVPAEYELEYHERVEPTTEADGNVEYWYCAGCDCYFVMDDEGNLVNTNAKNVIIPKLTTPQTGDNTSLLMLVGLLVVSAMGIVAVVFTKKRRVA